MSSFTAPWDALVESMTWHGTWDMITCTTLALGCPEVGPLSEVAQASCFMERGEHPLAPSPALACGSPLNSTVRWEFPSGSDAVVSPIDGVVVHHGRVTGPPGRASEGMDDLNATFIEAANAYGVRVGVAVYPAPPGVLPTGHVLKRGEVMWRTEDAAEGRPADWPKNVVGMVVAWRDPERTGHYVGAQAQVHRGNVQWNFNTPYVPSW